jgi:hypothetical protein
VKAFFFSTLLLLASIWANGQDKNLKAQMHYNIAEDNFNRNILEGYTICIKELEKAEQSLGETNAKIMDLKTRAYVKWVFQINWLTGVYILDTCLKKFFSLASPQSYPEEKYIQMLKLQSDVQDYKNTFNKEDSILYTQDYTIYSDTYALFYIHREKMKPALPISFLPTPDTKITKHMISDTLHSLFDDGKVNYYAIPIKVSNKGGYLYWAFKNNMIGGWYMAFKDKEEQKSAISNQAFGFFESFRHDKKNTKIIIQNSVILLKPNTEYYIWFASSEKIPLELTRSLPILYSIYLTDTPKDN